MVCFVCVCVRDCALVAVACCQGACFLPLCVDVCVFMCLYDSWHNFLCFGEVFNGFWGRTLKLGECGRKQCVLDVCCVREGFLRCAAVGASRSKR